MARQHHDIGYQKKLRREQAAKRATAAAQDRRDRDDASKPRREGRTK